jgi:hypothetical protein
VLPRLACAGRCGTRFSGLLKARDVLIKKK